jgi:ubiquinone/menaquinone biosynthesis C-methylase UbiE
MQDTASQIAYWDRVAPEKRFSHPLRTDWLTKYLKHDARIVDCGCGYGRSLAELWQARYVNITGLDFSSGMLSRCQTQVPGASLIRNDGHSLPLLSNSLDAVLLFAFLTCIPESDQQRTLISEVARVLRPGGLIYISDLLVNTDERNRERYEDNLTKHGCYGVFELPEGVVVRHHTREWITELTREFMQLEYEPFTVTTMNGNASAAFQYLGRKSG